MKNKTILDYIKMKLIPEKYKQEEMELMNEFHSDLELSPEKPNKEEVHQDEEKIIHEKAKKNWKKFQKKHFEKKTLSWYVNEKTLLKVAILLILVGLITFAYKFKISYAEEESLSFDSSKSDSFLHSFSVPISLTSLGVVLLLYYVHRSSNT